tara:strand:+ start:4249 stop:4872 length:624 start_codon:yes stop_codon:yes gene_type:complete
MSKNNLVDKLLDLDLMPLGKKETLTVTKNKKEIPPFKKLLNVNSKKLYDDFLNHTNDDGYINSRSHIFAENNIDVDEYKQHMNNLGFKKDNYAVWPLRDTKGNLIISENSYTYSFLNSWPTGIFRPQYNITLNDWKAENHIDYNDDTIHGFRVLIPLNESSIIEIDETVYTLEINKSYFVDVTKSHSAKAKKDRVVLSFQMDNDILL